MHFLDVAILVILGAFLVIGFARGIIRQIGFIIGFIVSLLLARQYYDDVAFYLKPSLEQWPFIADPLAAALGFFIVYGLVGIAFHILIRILDALVNLFAFIPFLRLTNRAGGALIGLIEGILLSSAILYVVSIIPMEQVQDSIRQSRFAPLMVRLAGIIKPLLPDFSSVTIQPPQTIDVKEFEKQLQKFQINPNTVRDTLKQYNIDTKGLENLPGLAPKIFKDAASETKKILEESQKKFTPQKKEEPKK
ncbi:CvpA family protein [Candidatus Uhrbacteria bacterium]|nr:CvpA family protein [Candidatus Uhrbacteria bacterium]